MTLTDLTTAADAYALPALGSVDDDTLMRIQSDLAGVRRRVDAVSAEVAAEIARRSHHTLGYGGLAQRVGARTPERLVQKLTGSSIRDARTLVQVGRIITPTAPADPGEAAATIAASSVLGDAVRSGAVSVEQVRAIEVGLGPITDTIRDEVLDPARRELIALAPTVAVEELRAHARVLRDDLDSAGVADRERALRDKRYLALYPQDDGMTRVAGLLDPESAARVRSVVDAALSTRRGGPRFVDPDDRSRASELEADPRTNDQIALDALIVVLDAGATADTPDTRAVLGRHGAPVQILVTHRDLASGTGYARIAGQESAVSIGTAVRRICTDGALPLLFSESGTRVLNLGTTQRLFTRKQRIALAARDGGCRRCGRPPSQCEAHHIIPASHGGPTDLDNGILLCRHCHMLIHDTLWRIERDIGGGIWFIPPPDIDPLQRRIPAHPPDPVLRRLVG